MLIYLSIRLQILKSNSDLKTMAHLSEIHLIIPTEEEITTRNTFSEHLIKEKLQPKQNTGELI